tara:strand:+ start:733 stop:1086 length:354 start_codon:yes stop_codon:yes gene_type:complete
MENLTTTILPLIVNSLIVICSAFCAELVHRSYKLLQVLSRENTKPFPLLTDGWQIIKGLLNINIGAVIFLFFTWCAASMLKMVPIGSIWTEALITIWFIMVFSAGFKISSKKGWKLF